MVTGPRDGALRDFIKIAGRRETRCRLIVIAFHSRTIQFANAGHAFSRIGVIADHIAQAHVAWERTEWGRILLLFRHITTLQPRVLLFWDTAAWHMAWNASVAAMNDRTQPRLALRVKAQREYFALGKDFLERGIKNNPDRPQLYEALARLYKEKYKDHQRASELYAKAAAVPDAATFDRRFSAYELSYCEGREREAYERLRSLYDEGEQERLPTLIARLKFLEDKLTIPQDQRIPDKGPVGR